MSESGSDTSHIARRWRLTLSTGFLLLFLALTWFALYTVPGQNLDNLSMEAMRARSALMPRQLNILTSLVSVPAIAVVAAGVLLVGIARRRLALALRAVALVACANVATQLVKAALTRPDLGVSWTLENSYPSGHTTVAASISVALVMVAPRGFRAAAAFFGWAWTTLMAGVVIANGWHRLADVLGSILIVAIFAFALSPKESRGRVMPQLETGGTVSAAALCVGGAFFYGVAIYKVRNVVFIPLSQEKINNIVEVGDFTGLWFTVGTMLLAAALSAVVLNALDRLAD